ncbi:MAG: hypothetical protein NUV86_09280, partial [Candidatus Scalindua sp.]|nr:hypothetical protein [Candidatus Scalindua sp.]
RHCKKAYEKEIKLYSNLGFTNDRHKFHKLTLKKQILTQSAQRTQIIKNSKQRNRSQKGKREELGFPPGERGGI